MDRRVRPAGLTPDHSTVPASATRTGAGSHPSRGVPTKSVHGADPDGNESEIMWMLPREAWGEFESSAPVERLQLDAEVARWPGVRTAGRIVTDAADEAGADERTQPATS